MKKHILTFLLAGVAILSLVGCSKHPAPDLQEAASREYTKNFTAQIEKIEAGNAKVQDAEETAEKERTRLPTEERVTEEQN